MRISQLSLKNFRTYPTRDFSFDPDLTIIAGPNGAGKTNVLEGVYLLATGESWRGGASEEMVGFGEEVAHVEGEIETRDRDRETLHITLTHGILQGTRISKAKYLVDSVPKRKGDFVGRLKVVLFEPQSLMIVIGDPSYRRGFLDDALSQTDAEYRNDLHVYARALKVRNRLLDAIREGKAQRESLDYWERVMVKHGSKIQEARRHMVEWLHGSMAKTTSASKGLSLQGQSFFELRYEPSVMSEERLESYREREIAAGFSLVGPQRDDFTIIASEKREVFDPEGLRPEWASSVKGKPLAQYGSRGEQRMAVLMLKLAEAQWIEEKTGESPVLVLDDIYSELDDEHDQMVGELVRGRQTIITATEKPSADYASNQIIRL